MKNFGNVFSFTLTQKIKGKGYIAITLALTLVFALIPAVSIVIADLLDDDPIPEIKTDTVFVVDNTAGNADYSVLSMPDTKIEYRMAENTEKALKGAETIPFALVLVVEDDSLTILRPNESEAGLSETELLGQQIQSMFSLILAQKAGITAEQLGALSLPNEIVSPETEASEEEQIGDIRDLIAMIAPMLILFILYFMVLLYGNNVANVTIMEKTSKLMDTFLLSVKPETLMLGKVCATALAGILQIFLWLGGLFGGLYLGKAIVLAINPESDLLILRLLSSLSELSEIISIGGLLFALPLVILGFLLYCTLAAISGAMAGKQEDLTQTNYVFAITLVISFLLCMDTVNGASTGIDWLCYFPFTAVLVLPGKAIVGQAGALVCLASLGIMAASCILVGILAGKIYRLTAFYRGNALTPKKVIEMLKRSK